MPERRLRKRTTGCKQQHDGPYCRDCSRVRVQRFRKAHGTDLPPRLPLTDAQRLANRAGSYVRKYLKRGAIAPPDGCERCGLGGQVAPSRPLLKLYPWHPDPAQPQLVAWLCAPCRRRLRATREPLTLTWKWPGLTAARSRKPVQLPQLLATALAAVQAKFPAGASASLRDAALIATLVATLAPGQRERLYAAGSLRGPPTADLQLNALLRGWVFSERAERGASARASGGSAIIPLAAEPRRQRRSRPAPDPEPRPAFDPEAAWAAIQHAADALDAAEAAVLETNARVAGAVRERFG
jgi:hypothetical protein